MLQSARLKSPKKIRLAKCDDRLPEPGAVSVRIHTCGVNTIDVLLVDGFYPAQFPVVPGHEISGTVEEIGKGVTSVAPGDPVVIDPHVLTNDPGAEAGETGAMEDEGLMFGVHAPYDGGFQDRGIFPAVQCRKIPQGVSLEDAVFAEPLACCIYAVDRLRIKEGRKILIAGAGPCGQLMIQLIRSRGGQVLVVEPLAHRRAVAESFGAEQVVPLEQAKEAVADLSHGSGMDAAIECSGMAGSLQSCCERVKQGGRVLQFGVHAHTVTVEVRPYDLFRRQLQILGSYMNPHLHERALRMIADGAVSVDNLITRRYPVPKVPQALADCQRGEGLKTVIQPSGSGVGIDKK